MNVTDPYRLPGGSWPTEQAATEHSCAFCRLKRALSRVHLRRVAIAALALAFLAVNGATAVVAFESMRLSTKVLTVVSAMGPGKGHKHGPKAASTPPPTPPSSPTTSCFNAPPSDIERLDTNVFRIDRPVVDRTLQEVASGLGATRVNPEGHAVGRFLVGITPGSWLERLGFQNGDTLLSVNGHDVGTPEEALDAYARLRSSSEVVVSIGRAGMLRTLTYYVR